ncbi:MAG: 3-isopropylmalate dehydrogenase [Acidobacteriota bacterium]
MNSAKAKKIVVLPGDGIGLEVTAVAVAALQLMATKFGHCFEISEHLIGGAALREKNSPLPEATLASALSADAVLLGAVGSPEFNRLPFEQRPEAGLLALRKHMNTFANLRPVRSYQALQGCSPLSGDRSVDLLIVRELTGGLYFGEPRGRKQNPAGKRVAINTLVYSEEEIAQVARIAFDAARQRRNKVTSVDKANVLETSQLWREVVNEVAQEYRDIEVEHLYIDNCAMQLILHPERFDVLLMENMFGDILSDEAAVLVGSLGLLPSASIGAKCGLYEPVHGSAPDIAGLGKANPVGALLSAAMLLRYSLEMETAAQELELAVESVLNAGIRTADIAGNGPVATTRQLGVAVFQYIAGNGC